jgi:thermitase
VAHLAAAAALWLAHHGRDRLIAKYGARNIQAAFLAVLRWPRVCVVPAHWNFDWGIGRVDLVTLLTAPLPNPGDLDSVGAFGDETNDAASRIAYAINADPVLVRTRLAALLKASDPEQLAELLELHEGELVYLAYTDPSFAAAASSPGDTGAFAPEINAAGVSATLGSLLTT